MTAARPGHHRNRCEHHFKHVPVNRGAAWQVEPSGAAQRLRSFIRGALPCVWWRSSRWAVRDGSWPASPWWLEPGGLGRAVSQVGRNRTRCRCDDDVVLDQRRHRRLFQLFNDFRCTDPDWRRRAFSMWRRSSSASFSASKSRVVWSTSDPWVRPMQSLHRRFLPLQGWIQGLSFPRWFGRFVFNLRSSHSSATSGATASGSACSGAGARARLALRLQPRGGVGRAWVDRTGPEEGP